MVQTNAKVTRNREYEVICDLSNGVIFSEMATPGIKLTVLFRDEYLNKWCISDTKLLYDSNKKLMQAIKCTVSMTLSDLIQISRSSIFQN